MADPFSISTGIVGLLALALNLVVGTLGIIDKTTAAHQEAADELKNLQEDLQALQAQMVRIHRTLEVLASNTKDRGFKRLLRDHHGEEAVADLRIALDQTFIALSQLTDRKDAEELNLRSIALPTETKSLAFVQAVLKHNLAPSTMTNLLKCLQDMRSEIQKCLNKLNTTFQHVWNLYNAMTNGLSRVATNASFFSTSTALTARIKLVGWLKDREDTWKISRRRKPVTEVRSPDSLQVEPAASRDHVLPITLNNESGNGSDRSSSIVLVLGMCIGGFIPARDTGPYFSPTPYWCWCTCPTRRYITEYPFMFASFGLSLIFYFLLFFRLRGNTTASGAYKVHFGQQVKAVGKQMLWNPITYTVLVLPFAAARYPSFSGAPVLFPVTAFTSTPFTMDGFVNALLFCITQYSTREVEAVIQY